MYFVQLNARSVQMGKHKITYYNQTIFRMYEIKQGGLCLPLSRFKMKSMNNKHSLNTMLSVICMLILFWATDLIPYKYKDKKKIDK